MRKRIEKVKKISFLLNFKLKMWAMGSYKYNVIFKKNWKYFFILSSFQVPYPYPSNYINIFIRG